MILQVPVTPFVSDIVDERFRKVTYLRPARNLVLRPKAADTNAIVIQLTNIHAWRRGIHTGNKSQNQNPFVCFGLDGQI